MPRSSGTYTLYTPGNPVVTGTSISSAWANNTLNDIASALTQSWPRDGTAPPTANIPMGSFKFTGLAAGSALTDSVTLGQVQNSGPLLIIGVAGTDTITGSIVTPTLAAYTAGQRFNFVAAGTNTGAATININALGAKAITKNGATALAAGDIVSGAAYSIFYDGTQFQLSVLASAPTPDYLNTTRIDVASAATVNLTSSAPNTRNINITGTTTITAFTVAAGQTYFVRFNASLTLTNNANIVTNLGASIVTQAGDTCILRATAANVVEVLSFTGIATNAQAIAGTDATHYLTPATLFAGMNASGSAPLYACRAWATFTGSTGALLASGNVSSITRVAAGRYTVNFSTAMPDANFSLTGTFQRDVSSVNGTGNGCISGDRVVATPRTTTAASIVAVDYAGSVMDPLTVFVQFFR